MSAPPQRMDDLQANADSSATVDPVGIKQFIADRESSIDRISNELLKEEARVGSCVDAIKDLELAISQRTTALEAHEQCLAALLLIQLRIKKQGLGEPAPTTRESHSGALQRVRVLSSGRIALGSGAVDEEVEVAQRKLQEIRCSIVELELELDSWRDLHELSTAAVESLSSLKVKEGAILEKGRMKGKRRLMWRLPIEVWNKIFKWTTKAEVETFRNTQYLTQFHLVIPTLSRVCRAWRSMVAIMPELTSYVPIPPRLNGYNNGRFFHFISKPQAPITLGCRLSPGHGTRICPPGMDDGQYSILEGKPYTLQLYTYGRYSYFAKQIADIPFKQSASIVVIPQNANTNIFAHNTGLKTIRSLTLVTDLNCITANLHSAFPALTTLDLTLPHITYSYQVRLDYIFVVSLRELHIRVKYGAARLCLDHSVNMANLQVFGITEPGGSIIYMMRATDLRTLILYYSTPETPHGTYWSHNVHSHISNRLSCLELHDWNDPIRGPSENSTAVVLRVLVPSKPALRSVRIVGGRINGEELVKVMTELAPRKLELTLAFTSGITRDQCDKLKPLTSELHIYV